MSDNDFDDILKSISSNDTTLTPPIKRIQIDDNMDGMLTQKDIDKNKSLTHKKSEPPKKPKRRIKKSFWIFLVIIVLIVAIYTVAQTIYVHSNKKVNVEQISTTVANEVIEKLGVTNPLTGESGFNKSAMDKRPVAVMVDNESSADSIRPQWGINSADVIVEAEGEYSTRLLMVWADSSTIPSSVGPVCAARPVFMNFASMFNSVFICNGSTNSKGEYTGADYYLSTGSIDYVNAENDSFDSTYFGRDTVRTDSKEFTTYFNGENADKLFTEKNINSNLDENKLTQFTFNKEIKPLSSEKVTSCKFDFSTVYEGGNCNKTASFSYDTSIKAYTTTDFDSAKEKSNVAFTNLVFLYADTSYKEGIYCTYDLTSGDGEVVSCGTKVDIKWTMKDGKLELTQKNGDKLLLNPGKIYIAFGSANHGGILK